MIVTRLLALRFGAANLARVGLSFMLMSGTSSMSETHLFWVYTERCSDLLPWKSDPIAFGTLTGWLAFTLSLLMMISLLVWRVKSSLRPDDSDLEVFAGDALLKAVEFALG